MIPKVIAIDYGTVRVGLAVNRGSLADPLLVLPNTEKLFPALLSVFAQEAVTLIVVGISENEMAEKTRLFIEKLRQHTSIPIIVTDETLSSKTVLQKLARVKKQKHSGPIDHFAAAEFLQEWLDIHTYA